MQHLHYLFFREFMKTYDFLTCTFQKTTAALRAFSLKVDYLKNYYTVFDAIEGQQQAQ